MNLSNEARQLMLSTQIDGQVSAMIQALEDRFQGFKYRIDVFHDDESGVAALQLIADSRSIQDISLVRKHAHPFRQKMAKDNVSFYIGEAV